MMRQCGEHAGGSMRTMFRGHVAVTLCALASLAVDAGPLTAQERVPHVEACVQKAWGFLESLRYRFGTVNTCDKPIVVWLMMKDGRTIQRTVEPGDVFRTNISDKDDLADGWAFAACPAGHAPDVPITDENWDAIQNSKYACARN